MLTADIHRSWLSVIRRLQSVAPSRGYSIVTIRALVGPSGDPVPWAEPKVVRLEPANSAEIRTRLKELAEAGTLGEFLDALC